ncbi:MAG: universal stress protein [Burkholderiales bacterium]
MSARLADLARKLEAEQISNGNPVFTMKGEANMQKVLVPVDGTRNSEFALRHVVNEFMKNSGMEIHLLNVQPPFSRHISQFVGRKARDSFHHDEAEKALLPAKQLVEKHGVPYSTHIKVGDKAEVIVEEAKRLGCDRIAMSTARKNSITRMIEDSTTNRVIEMTSVPVEVIAGDSVSKFERYGLPAGLAAALGLLVAAAMD